MSSDRASWLASNAAMAQPANVRLATEILLYLWWNVWKERNRRVFDSTQRSVFRVACAVKEEVEMFLRAVREFMPP
jgi:hypothetical protein